MAQEVGAVKIPAYNFADPSLWFLMCEATFELGNPKAISESKTKFNYIASNLPPEAATVVRDIIANPDKTDPYGVLKRELIKRSGESSHQEIRKLLIGEQLGDRRPTDLLRVMRRRAESYNVPEELMMELFLQHLPTPVQSIIAAVTPLSLEKAADIADRVMEVTPMPVSACSVSSVHSIEDRLFAEIKKLNERIDEISLRRGRSPHRNHASRTRSKSRSRTFATCWYHHKFGQNAKKCVPPCNFEKNDDGRV